jgi:hypothetical protein
VNLEELEGLLVAAGEAPPETRIGYRDRIAAHGSDAIDRMSGPAWIGDPRYTAFAIRTIGKAGEMGARDAAVTALRAALARDLTEAHRNDVVAALKVLGVDVRSRPKGSSKAPRVRSFDLALEELVVGQCYTRTELHDALGGNRQKGISYPADGNHCLLFSDPSKASEHGYRDAPVGEVGYRYFGEWDGPGDMQMTAGNRAVMDRSPELYLFTRATCGQVFRGRYLCVGWDSEKTTRDGQSHNAIVFQLQRVHA